MFWPAVKALLKDAGYRPDQLYFVGDYRDPAIVALMQRLGREAMPFPRCLERWTANHLYRTETCPVTLDELLSEP